MDVKESLRICAISDLHEQWDALRIPQCDLLVVAGDITYTGDYNKVVDFNNWCYKLKQGRVGEIVVIAGNHDISAEKTPDTFRALLSDAVYLCDQEVTAKGLRVYGSPWTPSFYRQNWVFNADRGREIMEHWSKIPQGLDILVTHGPPFGIRDLTPMTEHVGCLDLLNVITGMGDKAPRLHIFGHIHAGYGMAYQGRTVFMNASVCTERYKPTNPPLVIDL